MFGFESDIYPRPRLNKRDIETDYKMIRRPYKMRLPAEQDKTGYNIIVYIQNL